MRKNLMLVKMLTAVNAVNGRKYTQTEIGAFEELIRLHDTYKGEMERKGYKSTVDVYAPGYDLIPA